MKQKIIKIIKSNVFLIKIYNFLNKNKFIMRGKQNHINIKPFLMKNCKIVINGNNNQIVIGKNCGFVNAQFHINGNNNKIIIGENCILINVVVVIGADDSEFSMGSNTKIGYKLAKKDTVVLVIEPKSKVKIGDNCLVSYDVEIRNGDSHFIMDKDSNNRVNFGKNIIIEDHVWIAAYSSILKGVTIKQGSIVGTRSVVTNDVPAFTIVAGTPARIIRENIIWKA